MTWPFFRGNSEPHDAINDLPPPPPWRTFDGIAPADGEVEARPEPAPRQLMVGRTYRPTDDEVRLVNAALLLRRPLLVTGPAGLGKSSLIYAVANELKLGPVLKWPITSRSTLLQGLYEYDALARLQDTNLEQPEGAAPSFRPSLGNYITLGPLGTALLPSNRPRALLIDEIDKSDVDLPNDLLHVFEEGEFPVWPLNRSREQGPFEIFTYDGERVGVQGSPIRSRQFPFVVLTSNGERDFPAPFLRRCIRFEVRVPNNDVESRKRFESILAAHLPDKAGSAPRDLVAKFVAQLKADELATDQLLNAAYLTLDGGLSPAAEHDALRIALLRSLKT